MNFSRKIVVMFSYIKNCRAYPCTVLNQNKCRYDVVKYKSLITTFPIWYSIQNLVNKKKKKTYSKTLIENDTIML